MLRTVSGVNDGAHASRHCQPNAMWRTSSRRISSISRRTAGFVALWMVALNTSMRISSAAHTRLAKMPSSAVSGSNAMRRTPWVPTAPAVGHQPGRLGVAPFFHGAHGEEELQIRQPPLQAEAQQQRRALRDGAVLAPRAPAPVHLRRQPLLGAVALGMELLPRNVRLRVPLERLRPLPQLPHVGHGRRERQRVTILEHVRLRALLVDQHAASPLDFTGCRARDGTRAAPPASTSRTARAPAPPSRAAHSALAAPSTRPARRAPSPLRRP